MKIRLPSTRKGRVWLSVGAFIGAISVVGGISDAAESDQSKQYKVCMEAYHNAKHCYEDVYNHRAPSSTTTTTNTTPPSPSDTTPSVPDPTSWNPNPANHFFFYPDTPLDTTQVIDQR